MNGQDAGDGKRYHYVTLAELDAKLDDRPTRWEVRFLVICGFIGAQVTASFVPMTDVARAALSLLP